MALSQALTGRRQETGEDITLTFNSNKNYWYFDGDQNNNIQPDQYDFKTSVLRALTQVFGFKASVNTTRPDIKSITFPTPFDAKIVNTNNVEFRLLDLNNRNAQRDFIQGGNVYFDNPSLGLKLYAPNPFVRDKSLDYFDSEEGLMTYNFEPNSIHRTIDEKVIKVMHTIGWPIKETAFNINASMGTTGIGSVYESYTFTGSAVTGNITNHYWEYRIKRKNAAPEVISTSGNPTFSINPLAEIKNEYDTSSDGDILGEIFLKGEVNGVEYTTTFNVYLEAIPSDIIHDFKIIGIDEWYFKVEVNLKAFGATSFGMTVTDWEENLTLSTNYEAGNYIKANTFTLTYDSPILFSFRARNQYGTKTKNVTLPPISYNYDSQAVIQSANNNHLKNTVKYKVMTLSGEVVKYVNSEEEIYDGSISNGFYVIKKVDDGGRIINTNKIIINK